MAKKSIVITESELTVEGEKRGPAFSWDRLSEIRQQVFGDKVEGFTISEYAEKYGLPIGRAAKDVFKLQRLGHVKKMGTRVIGPHAFIAVYATVSGGKNSHGDVSSSSNGRRR